MDVELKGKVDLLVENYWEMKKALRWDGDILNHYEALIYGTTERTLNLKRVKEIRKYIRKNNRNLNIFNGSFFKIFSLLLEDQEDYKEVFNETIRVYNNLILAGFNKNERTLFASLILAKRFTGKKLEERISRLINIKQTLENRQELSSIKGDYLSYANLAILNNDLLDIERNIFLVIKKIKEVGIELNKNWAGFAAALVLDNGDVNEKIEKALEIKCLMKGFGLELSDKCYPLVGLASLMVEDAESFSMEIRDVYLLLKKSKGYGYFMKSDFRLLMSLGLVLNKYVEEIRADLIDVNISEEISMLLTLEEFAAFSIASFQNKRNW